MPRLLARLIPTALGASALALAACADRLTPGLERAPLPPLDSGARSALVLVDSSPGRATVAVYVEAGSLGAYQGTVSYDAAALRLEGATVPEDGTRLVNTRRPGLVRIAGFGAEGLAGREAARLEFRVSDWDALRRAAVSLQVVATGAGERVARDRVRATTGVHAPRR